jgi:hypothetical protein
MAKPQPAAKFRPSYVTATVWRNCCSGISCDLDWIISESRCTVSFRALAGRVNLLELCPL